jgi:hypothetical protein
MHMWDDTIYNDDDLWTLKILKAKTKEKNKNKNKKILLWPLFSLILILF